MRRWLPLLALPACTGPQAPLDAWGPQAGRIAELSVLLMAGGGLILLLVSALVAAAVWAPARWRRRMGTRGFALGMGVAFPVAVLSALLVHAFAQSRALALLGGEAPLRIEVVGRQYWWEVRYPELGLVTANEIRLPVGRAAELVLTSADVIHSLWIPNLHGKLDMIPGRANAMRLRADRTGELRGQCTEFCGRQHTLMAFAVVVEEPEAFARWAERLTAAPSETTEAQRAGRRVFAEAGCGACHAVAGTEWQGRLAPDLSGLALRRTLAAGALPNTRGHLMGWIAAPQDIKPGNAMPAYARSLSGAQINALADWLESLR